MTSKKNTPTESQASNKKGGGDGKAKGTGPQNQSSKRSEERSPSEVASESGVRSRKITSSHR